MLRALLAKIFDCNPRGRSLRGFLIYNKSVGGGAPAAYKVMHRERPEGPWQEVATAVITEATLVEQPRGKELEYRIIAVKKTGEGEPSNTAMVVL